MRMSVEIIEEGRYDVVSFADELAAAPGNQVVGTSHLFENDRVRVWEVRLAPGERTPFHAHVLRYFWTCVDPGVGRQRYADGTMKVLRYHGGDTLYSEHSSEAPMLHDLENVGETPVRFVTVELL
jgi:beta-alanine degradation protein BauB